MAHRTPGVVSQQFSASTKAPFRLVLQAGSWIFRTAATRLLAVWLLAALCFIAHAQAREGVMSEREIDTLRDAAFVPNDRLFAYEKILDTREKLIDDLVAKPHHVTYASDLHDYMEQFAGIVDELNDNLDDYRDKHRDIRKALPKLIQATERWSTSLRAPEEKQEYKIVRRLALDALKDTHEILESLQTSQAEYFKAHPEAAKAEKDRLSNPHAVGADGPP